MILVMMKLNKVRLRQEMDRNNLSTYQDLADRMKIKSRQGALYYFKNGSKLSLKTINKLARVLGCDPKDLLI